MHNNSFFKQLLFLISIVLFASCDKDFNEIGADLIGDNHFDFKSETFSVVAYNQAIGTVQSDNLPVNSLGIYDNPAFGKTTVNFATQLFLEVPNPTIGANVVIDSVYLDIPYFVDALKTKAVTAGGNTYELDSIYEPKSPNLPKIKLSVYESGYSMSTYGLPRDYYTDQNSDFDNYKIGSRLNDDASVAQNDEFTFSPLQRIETTTDAAGKKTYAYLAPRMHLNLNKSFFNTKIINAATGKLTSNETFIEYFRGLYFKVENSGSSVGSLAMLDFKKGKITIKYKEDLSTIKDGVTTTTRVEKTIVLNMSGNAVSLLQNSNPNSTYTTALSSANTTLGDERLYLKGGEGSMAVIKLFGPDLYGSNGITGVPNGVADELDIIRTNKWLINEANLVFHIDATSMANSFEPQRIYLYDLNNNRPIMDYFTDVTQSTVAKKSKLVFDGNLNKEKVTNGRGLTYKIRITDQIRGLIKNADSTNVKLGLVVTEDIVTVTSGKLKTPNVFPFKSPKASIMNPLGTILYGSKSSPNVPQDKKLKLEIYYTKPKPN